MRVVFVSMSEVFLIPPLEFVVFEFAVFGFVFLDFAVF